MRNLPFGSARWPFSRRRPTRVIKFSCARRKTFDAGHSGRYDGRASGGWPTIVMAPEEVITWLKAKREKALVTAGVYSAFVLAGGAVVLAFTMALVVIAGWIGLFYFFPHTTPGVGWSLTLGFAVIAVVVFFLDSVRAVRDDMSILPLWLAREY